MINRFHFFLKSPRGFVLILFHISLFVLSALPGFSIDAYEEEHASHSEILSSVANPYEILGYQSSKLSNERTECYPKFQVHSSLPSDSEIHFWKEGNRREEPFSSFSINLLYTHTTSSFL